MRTTLRSAMAVVLLSAGLGACALGHIDSPVGPIPVPIPAPIVAPGGNTIPVTTVQDYARQLCGFLPTAETITNIFVSGNAIATTAQAVADAICRSVTTNAVARHGARPMVFGIAVHGKFVGKRKAVRRLHR